MIDANGGEQRKLPRYEGGSAEEVSWLPKTTDRLVVSGDAGKVISMTSDGSQKGTILTDGFFVAPAPSPTGKKLLLEVPGPVPDNANQPQLSALAIADTDTDRVHPLTQPPS